MSELIQISGSQPEGAATEFPGLAEELDSASRRTVLKLMAASFGLAGLTACSRPVEKIVPASRAGEGQVPGKAVFYATAMPLGGFATGLVVEAHDGRPTKIEGNPTHPFSRGAASAFHQASILGLYDPDRARAVLHHGALASWEEFAAWAATLTSGARLRFLSQTVNSPSLEAIREHALERFREARWIEWEPLSRDEELAGAELAFGKPVETVLNPADADVIVALDADFLGLDSPAIAYTKDFARRRRAERMNRLYVVESQYSVTGGMADHRLRMRSSDVGQVAAELAGALGLAPAGRPRKWVAAAARDLKRSAGRSLVIAGRRQPAAIHALAHQMNHALGNAGKTVAYVETARRPQLPALKQLAAELAAGQVDALVVLGGNPAYDAPADLDFAHAMKKAPVTVHLAAEPNETAVLATWQLPEAHYLETWGDARAVDGTASIQQPLIQPLYGGRSAAEVVALLSGYKDQRGYDLVHNYWRARLDEKAWRRALDSGVVSDTAAKTIVGQPLGLRQPPRPPNNSGGIEVNFHPSAATWDGRFANNGWMQEAPDPMTQLTWDNAALLSPATARKLGVANGDVIAIAAEGREIEMPAWIQLGHADDSLSVALGYGRTECGRVGQNVGHNAYRLRTTAALETIPGATVKKTGRRHQLVTTQEHHSLEGRPLVREATLDQYRREPEKPAEKEDLGQLFPAWPYDKGNQWGMAIDLNACIGCNACVLACQAENNIPIVGKEQVSHHREMHWIRVDRYYAGPEEDPQTLTQPVNCQQCENAPCEAVCPVAATNHSPEGLNDMAYNRCIGTRYCSNNCPYKVRRFNFLNYHKDLPEVEKMVFNPDVTVRMRGVMEKCTYCVQRIQEGKIRAKLDGHRPLGDGEVLTACQQTCPAEAIAFGNINDPNSRVAQLKKSNRNYSLLEELNTRPRTTYLAKLRNPNPELA